MIKFLCKDLWTILFRKQIDNLKTNHRVRTYPPPPPPPPNLDFGGEMLMEGSLCVDG